MADLVILSNHTDGHAGAGTSDWAGLLSGAGKNFNSTSDSGTGTSLSGDTQSILAGADIGNNTHAIRQTFLTFEKPSGLDLGGNNVVTSAQLSIIVRDSVGAPRITPLLGNFNPTLAPSPARFNAFGNTPNLANPQLVSSSDFTGSITHSLIFDLNSFAIGILNDSSIDHLLVMLIDYEYNYTQTQPASGDFNLTNIYYTSNPGAPVSPRGPKLLINFGSPGRIKLNSGLIQLTSGKVIL